VTIDASAADNGGGSGVNYVQFWDGLPGTGTLIGTDFSSPYNQNWNTAGDGAHNLYVRVYDFAGNYLDSGARAVTVDNTAPSAAGVTNPAAGAYVKGTITINATATDAIGIKNVTFYRDAGILLGTDTTSPYSTTWNTATFDGAHTLYVRAFDNAGNYLDSATRAITVDNTNPTSAVVTSPTAGAYVKGTIWINATAADAIGIKNVTFYRGV
jgi:hypothetical protein